MSKSKSKYTVRAGGPITFTWPGGDCWDPDPAPRPPADPPATSSSMSLGQLELDSLLAMTNLCFEQSRKLGVARIQLRAPFSTSFDVQWSALGDLSLCFTAVDVVEMRPVYSHAFIAADVVERLGVEQTLAHAVKFLERELCRMVRRWILVDGQSLAESDNGDAAKLP